MGKDCTTGEILSGAVWSRKKVMEGCFQCFLKELLEEGA